MLIISPWITETIITNLHSLFEQAVGRGVRIKIIYGYYEGDSIDRSRRAANLLKERYGDMIELKERDTHYKLVISDEKFYIMGSMNFLSFGGDYSRRPTRDEGALYCNSRKEIRDLKEMYF